MTTIAQLPFFVGVTLAVVAAMISAGVVYGLGRLVIRGLLEQQTVEGREQTGRLAMSIFRISGTLMALILSLSLNGLHNDHTALRDAIQLEAAQVLDIAVDLGFFATDEADEIREQLKLYLRIVIDDEWVHLASGAGLYPAASDAFNNLQYSMHRLKTSTPEQESLRANLITDIDEVSDYRQYRAFQSVPDPSQFLYVALVGFLFTIAALVFYQPTVFRTVLIGIYSAFVGIVVYSMLALSSPFSGPAALSPEALVNVYQQISTK